MISQPMLPGLDDDFEMAVEEDAMIYYMYQWAYESNSSLLKIFIGNNVPFKDKNTQYHYENFRIKNVSKMILAILIPCFLLYLYGCVILFTKYERVWFMRTILITREVIVVLALYNYYKIFYARVSLEAEQSEFRKYVGSVTALSNFIIVTSGLVNGAAYAWKSSLGSCFVKNEDLELEVIDPYYYNCNPSFENGGTPVNSMLLLVVGNILLIVTLRCHSSWAARVNYFFTLMSCVVAAALSPDFGHSIVIIIFASLTIVIYESIDTNSLTVFKALLDLESTKRIQTKELKYFIGNVAHDLKVRSILITIILELDSLQCH